MMTVSLSVLRSSFKPLLKRTSTLSKVQSEERQAWPILPSLLLRSGKATAIEFFTRLTLWTLCFELMNFSRLLVDEQNDARRERRRKPQGDNERLLVKGSCLSKV
jgi:hypothetical protein